MMLYAVDRSAVLLKPTQRFLDWLHASLEKDGSQIHLTLSQIQANCRLFLVPEQDSPEEIITYIDNNYLHLFELELASWFESRDYWPKMSLQTFTEFFDIEVMDEVVDLVDEGLMNNPLD